jgi:hypothetical protein
MSSHHPAVLAYLLAVAADVVFGVIVLAAAPLLAVRLADAAGLRIAP